MHRPLREAQGRPFGRLRAGFTLAAAAALVLIAGACATPSAEKSAAGGSAETHAKDRGAKGDQAKGKKLPWWRLSQYSRKPNPDIRRWGDIRPGKGLLGNDEGGFVLYRQGEGNSSDPNKPTKLKR